MPETSLEMTQVQYAAHRGVTKQAINKLAKAGRLVMVAKPDGRKLIDVVASDRALGETRLRVDSDDDADDAAPAPYVPPGETGGLTRARTATEIYRARLAQLEYDEKVGKLLPVDDVVRAMRICGDAVARDIELLPNNAAELAAVLAQGGEAALRTALKKLSRQMLTTLAANMRLLASEQNVPPAAAPAEGVRAGAAAA